MKTIYESGGKEGGKRVKEKKEGEEDKSISNYTLTFHSHTTVWDQLLFLNF